MTSRMIYSAGPRFNATFDPATMRLNKRLDTVDWKRSAVAFKGRCRVEGGADTFFGGSKSKGYKSRVMENPTWGQLFECSKAQAERTNDRHHCFFEGYGVSRVEEIDGEPVSILYLYLGS